MTHQAYSTDPPHCLDACVRECDSIAPDGLWNGRNHRMHARSVERVIRAMMERLDQPMSNDKMAEIACQSRFHFNRVFHRLTGIPPTQFHYALRLQHAKRLLTNTDLRITDICFDVGYNSLGTFVSRFNELVGLSPSSFRRFARQLASADLREFQSFLIGPHAPAAPQSHSITGTITSAESCDGVVFSGLFRRGIPEGEPVSCALTFNEITYSISVPMNGHWFVFSVAVPWTVCGEQLLLLDGLPRGRSGLICCNNAEHSGDTAVALRRPNLLDPPILTAIPLLMWRRFDELLVPARRENSLIQPVLANAFKL